MSYKLRAILIVVITTCVILFFKQNFKWPTIDMFTIDESPEYFTQNTKDVDEFKRLLHGNVNQRLESGQLPLDFNKTSRFLWKDDPPESDCKNYSTRFGRQLPLVRLVSYPRSGNTWTRYLLEAATGVFTGSLYTANELYKAGYLGEIMGVDSGLTLVQKTHGHVFQDLSLSNMRNRIVSISTHLPAIFILRNPARSILSLWKYKNTRSMTAEIDINKFNTSEFHKFAEEGIIKWETLALDRLLLSKAPVYVLFYENLVVNPIQNLRSVLLFLRVPVDEGRLKCLSSHLDGFFKRQNKNEQFDPFNNIEKELMTEATMRINRTLQLLGYNPLPYTTII